MLRNALVIALFLFAGACRGPCGDPAIQCWTSLPGCNICTSGTACYQQYTGSGPCPDGYYCVDTRHEDGDLAPSCPMDLAVATPLDFATPPDGG